MKIDLKITNINKRYSFLIVKMSFRKVKIVAETVKMVRNVI